jgi:hypothetical protein
MSLPSQPPSSEEPEQKPTLHASEETPEQISPASDLSSDETEKQPVLSTSEDIPTQPPATVEPQKNEVAQQNIVSSTPDETEAPTQVSDAGTPDVTEAPTQVWANGEAPNWDDASTPAWTDTSPPEVDGVNEVDGVSEEDEEDEDFDAAPIVPVPSQTSRTGIFVHRGILIAAAIILVLAALLVSLLLFVNRPKDPPTDWISNTTSPTTATTSAKVVYYLHWTNSNGELKGQLQVAANSNGTPQSLTAPTTGLYNRDNHIIYVVVTVNGSPDTLMGKINDSNDTLTLNPAGATDTTNQLVFHIGTANDYKQDTQKINPPKK